MTPRPSATRIGLFAVGGLALIVGAVAFVLGGRLFADTERAVLYFDGSVRGLQVGSPLVLRGVQMGSVRSIGLVADGAEFRVPVIVQVDRSAIAKASGGTAADDPSLSIPALVKRGLTAKMATQSLLTGQRYVDLEMLPDQARAEAPTSGGLPEIPTAPPLLQTLQSQVEKIDVAAIVAELRGTLADARTLMRTPEIRRTLDALAQASASLARLSTSVERRVPALAGSAQQTMARAGQAAEAVGVAAQRIGGAAGRADALLATDSPTLVRVQQAADELAKTAAALRATTTSDSATVQQLQQSLEDVGRAARAVRQLAETLDQQPEVLIRGRSPAP